MKSEILKMLWEAQEYISGQEICNRMGVSRTAVWKVVNQLREEGYKVESVTNKGYRLVACPDSITKEAIESRIETRLLGRNVYYKEQTDSTNTEAKRLAGTDAGVDGLLVTAERQTAGKGRRGRTWISPAGTCIYMSLILKPDIRPVNASTLTLVAALAVCRAIKEETGLFAQIKWPNDIIINGRKICGILTEMSAEEESIHYVVVGMGINANQSSMEEFPSELWDRASSLLIEGGEKIDRCSLICRVMEKMEHYYSMFLQTEDMSGLLEEYNSCLVNIGKMVQVSNGKETITGTAQGIDKKGSLKVETPDGIKNIVSGEVSVRGLYGYV